VRPISFALGLGSEIQLHSIRTGGHAALGRGLAFRSLVAMPAHFPAQDILDKSVTPIKIRASLFGVSAPPVATAPAGWVIQPFGPPCPAFARERHPQSTARWSPAVIPRIRSGARNFRGSAGKGLLALDPTRFAPASPRLLHRVADCLDPRFADRLLTLAARRARRWRAPSALGKRRRDCNGKHDLGRKLFCPSRRVSVSIDRSEARCSSAPIPRATRFGAAIAMGEVHPKAATPIRSTFSNRFPQNSTAKSRPRLRALCGIWADSLQLAAHHLFAAIIATRAQPRVSSSPRAASRNRCSC